MNNEIIMLIKFNDWKSRIYEWAETNQGSCRIEKHIPVGSVGDSFTIEVTLKYNNFNKLRVSQSGGGTDIEVGLSYLKFEHKDQNIYNFDLSLYQKSFLDNLFNKNKLRTDNKLFNKKFGVITSNKLMTQKIFEDDKIRLIFFENPFLIFNVQRKESLVTLKSMARKLYEKNELQNLLNNFIYIIEVINKINN